MHSFSARLIGGCLIILVAMSGSLLAGCDSATDSPASGSSGAKTAEQTRLEFRATLANIDRYAEANGLEYDSPEAILAGARASFAATYGENSEQYRAMNGYLTTVAERGSLPVTAHRGEDALPEHMAMIVERVDEAVQTSETLGDLSNQTDLIVEHIDGTNWSGQEKEDAIIYAVTMDEVARYLTMHDYADEGPITDPESELRPPGWVRCALGTTGSAILGGLAGAGVAGPPGGIAGYLAGGMVGYATFC